MEKRSNYEKEIVKIAGIVEKEMKLSGLTSGVYIEWLLKTCKRVVENEMSRVRTQLNQELSKAREEGKMEVLEEMIKENGGNIIPSPEAIPTLMFRREIREYLNNKLSKLKDNK